MSGLKNPTVKCFTCPNKDVVCAGQIDIAFCAKTRLLPSSPLQKQEGGSHYKSYAVQPVEYIHANKIGYFEGNVIKYVTRWKEKGGIEDLKKAKHYIELLMELEQPSALIPPAPQSETK